MAISFSRPDPSSPTAVAGATFPSSRRGFDQNEVRDFLRMVAAELSRLTERTVFLEGELLNAQRDGSGAPVELNEETVAALLGEETARIVQAAREAATKIKIRSEETATRLVREATDEATRLREDAELESARRRQDAASDADTEILTAKQQGRDMVNEARAYRERVLADVARRREMAREQLEDLFHGRERLIQAFDRARLASEDVLRDLDDAGDEPSEFVNLAPTTGPIPVIVQADQVVAQEAIRSVISSAPAFAPYDQDEDTIVEQTAAEVVVEAIVHDQNLADEVIVLEETVVQEPISNVVSLFPRHETSVDIGDSDSGVNAQEPVTHLHVAPTPKAADVVADDIFAKLRRSSADVVAKEVATTEAKKSQPAKKKQIVVTTTETIVERAAKVAVENPVEDAIEVSETITTPFEARDEVLVPIIVAMGRKIKRVLADEQNEILDILRGKPVVKTLDAIVGPKSDHSARITAALESSVKSAAFEGAKSLSSGSDKELHKIAASQSAAIDEFIISTIVTPLRERLSRSISQAAGDNAELTALVRVVYREWKNKHVDEHVDDIAQTAYGRGAFAALVPGTKACWKVDPTGPACADAEDNSLAGFVTVGEAFPTGHTHAPAHAGCRCALVPQQN